MSNSKKYTFYAELVEYEPRIWRRFEIDGNKTIAELAYAVMIMFEMRAKHHFRIKEFREELSIRNAQDFFAMNGIPKYESMYDLFEEDMYELEKDIVYQIPVKSKKGIILQHNEKHGYPQYTKIDDMYGYDETILELIYNPTVRWKIRIHVEKVAHMDEPVETVLLEGAGYGIVEDNGDVQLEKMDKDAMNERLKKLIRMYRYIYEWAKTPIDTEYENILRQYMNGERG